MVGNILAATALQETARREPRLVQAMTATIAEEPRIFGMALAFEPGQFEPRRRDYCL